MRDLPRAQALTGRCHVADCRLRVGLGTDGRGRWLASVPTLHSRRILPQPRYSGSYLGRNGCPLAVDRLHSRSLKGKDACWTAHFVLRLNADDVTAAPSGGFSRPKMLKENQERIAWFDNPCLYQKLDSAIMMMKSAED